MSEEIFEGKSFQDLTQDIYKNTTDRRKQIDLLISEIHGFIQTIDDVVMVAPIIKEYMDVAVKNDEHLVKLAAVVQRLVGATNKDSGDEFGMSEEEKARLLQTAQEELDAIHKEQDEITLGGK